MSSPPAPTRSLAGAAVLADPFVGDAILMATASASRKTRNVERDPRAAFVVHDSRPGFEVCGASIEGRVEVVSGPGAVALVKRVHRRYVDADAERLPEVAAFLSSDDVALRLSPERAWTWDQRSTAASAQ